ncbi:MAG: hypothetical protein WBG36_08865 [Ornithinimicrobium sp.]
MRRSPRSGPDPSSDSSASASLGECQDTVETTRGAIVACMEEDPDTRRPRPLDTVMRIVQAKG